MVDRVITLKAGKTQKNLTRLTKWAGFIYDFGGNMHNHAYTGYKLTMRNGDMVIHLFRGF